MEKNNIITYGGLIALVGMVGTAGKGFLAYSDVKNKAIAVEAQLAEVKVEFKEAKAKTEKNSEKLKEEIDQEENINLQQQQQIEQNTTQQRALAEYIKSLKDELREEIKSK